MLEDGFPRHAVVRRLPDVAASGPNVDRARSRRRRRDSLDAPALERRPERLPVQRPKRRRVAQVEMCPPREHADVGGGRLTACFGRGSRHLSGRRQDAKTTNEERRRQPPARREYGHHRDRLLEVVGPPAACSMVTDPRRTCRQEVHGPCGRCRTGSTPPGRRPVREDRLGALRSSAPADAPSPSAGRDRTGCAIRPAPGTSRGCDPPPCRGRTTPFVVNRPAPPARGTFHCEVWLPPRESLIDAFHRFQPALRQTASERVRAK